MQIVRVVSSYTRALYVLVRELTTGLVKDMHLFIATEDCVLFFLLEVTIVLDCSSTVMVVRVGLATCKTHHNYI